MSSSCCSLPRIGCPRGTGTIRCEGNWKGCRDVHIESDWLLIYRVAGDELHLVRTSSHADLFDD